MHPAQIASFSACSALSTARQNSSRRITSLPPKPTRSCHTASKASEHLTPDHPEDAEADEIVQEVVDQAQAAEVIRPVGSDGSASNEPLHSGNGLVRDFRINPATGATEATAPVAASLGAGAAHESASAKATATDATDATEATAPVAPASLGAGAAHESAHEPVILVAELPRERKGWLVKSPPGLLISTSSRRFAMASSSGSGLRLGERSPNSPFMHMSGSATLNWAKARISAADNSESEEKQARAGVSVRDIVKMVTSRKSRASTTDSSTSSRWYGSVDN